MTRVLVVQNSRRSTPGRLPGWLDEEGLEPVVVQGDDLPDHLAGGRWAGIVLLGGGLMPDDDERAPFLARERALTAEALAAGVPLLGICLGAQLLAHVAGGEVTAGSGETERGSCPVRLLDAAAADAVLGPLTVWPELRMIENHQDSITRLPDGAVHLATSDACMVQAFRVGERAWGVQFHPEVAADRLAVWDESELANKGYDRATLLAEALADAPLNTKQARALVGAFAAVVRDAAPALVGTAASRTGTHSDGVPTVAFCVRRAGGPVLAERDAHRSFYAASTVKLAVLAAVARALDAGTATLDQHVTSTDTFTSQVPGAPDYRIDPDDRDPGMPAPGTRMPLSDVVERMVVASSNEATNLAAELVGLDAVNRVLADAGASTTTFGRKYSDLAAESAGASHRTTAGDLAALMSAIVTGALASPERTVWMTGLLGGQHDRLLTAAVPEGVPCGSKSGWVDGIRHDVAFVGEPGPDALVVAVCTRGYEAPDAEEAIRALGALALSLR